ncbi:succinyl-diaminopimelate desuccinylase [Polynucleobacter kasalickyi]|uniref:Succinyl-diaminopimelate desuccinylase n=1 Tax=Polynucleobacter kasalickyi TaxID=1938817 RepID=A0A1W1ZD58_9BURK|nr:succinyl-diaminopimelate desuccinylase [Polynucleobacter kasalickyi]SMC46307.1 succinyldiaminopimelate desuccinylase [Polynucleobacter kasalickyi]
MTDPQLTLTQQLAQGLIAHPSVTPVDGGIQQLIANRLKQINFSCETIMSGPDDFLVTNLWAIRRGSNGAQAKCLVFAGHTDVVPPGPLEKWDTDPFVPVIKDGVLYGRGAADMKSSLAAFVVATEEFVQAHPDHLGNIAFLLTSDEEGPKNTDGTVVVVNKLKERQVKLDYCIVGEPTSSHVFGDTIKNGRRGSLSAKLSVKGIQGHVAYPHLARNPIHQVAPVLAELAQIEWDHGNEYFPPTTWQTSNFHAGTGASNVIPGEAIIDFNFRFATASTAAGLAHKVEEILKKHQLEYNISWNQGGEPFLTPKGELCDVLQSAIKERTGINAELSTTGGTSDGRFIAKICPQVVEFGPINATIHQVNENVNLDDIESLKDIYLQVLKKLLLR